MIGREAFEFGVGQCLGDLAAESGVEGEATAHYVGELLLARGLKVSRIARGLPVGGELEHVDSGTLAQAVIERRTLESSP